MFIFDDSFEHEAWHLVAIDDENVVGCVMFNPEGPTGRILQMAVAAAHQKQGIGTELVRILEARLAREGFREAYLHARIEAVPFYERLGYAVFGDPFVEVGITHRMMKKNPAQK